MLHHRDYFGRKCRLIFVHEQGQPVHQLPQNRVLEQKQFFHIFAECDGKYDPIDPEKADEAHQEYFLQFERLSATLGLGFIEGQ